MIKKLHFKKLLLMALMLVGAGSAWAQDTWEETALADLTSTDVFVIVGTAGGNSYSMSNNNGTSTAPTAAVVTIADGKITSTVTDVMKWNVSGNSTDGYTFYPNGSTTTWLYCNTNAASSSNNNMRVGTGNRKVFVLDNDDHLLTKTMKDNNNNDLVNRYVCVYNGSDWRGYINTTTAATTIKFYKRVASSTPTCATPTFSPAGGTYTEDQSVNISTTTEGATIRYTTDGSEPTSSSRVYSMPIYAGSGVLTIKAIALKDGFDNSEVATATYAILEHAGTVSDPYTVADARNAIDAGVGGVTNVYATGIVSEIVTAYSSEFNNISFNISADGLTTGAQLQAYRCKKGEAADAPDVQDIKVGDVVVITGNLINYKGTYEFEQDCVLYSINPDERAEAGLAWSNDETVRIAKGATDSEYTLPTLTNPNNLSPITFTFTGTENLAIDVDGEILVDTDVVGEVEVTASFAGNAAYKPGSASFTIVVYDPNVKGSIYNPYTVAEVIDGTATGSDVYVKGFIVGEFPTNNVPIITSSFTTDANVALADVYSTSTEKASAIPVQLNTNALKATWGNKTNNGTTMGYQVLVKGKIASYFSVNGIKPASEVTAVAATATITDAKYATRSYKIDVDFSTTGVKAYTAKDNGSYVALTEITKVPANTPVVLYKDVTATTSVTVPLATTTDAVGDNDLRVSTGASVDNAYVLAKPSGKEVGFYKWAGTDPIPACKVYLAASASSARNFIGFGGETTSINSVNGNVNDNQEVYDLQGRRVAQPTKGLYIVNGKKVLVK